MKGSVEQEAFRSFGPIDEPYDTTGLFGSFGGLSGEETGRSAYMIDEGPVQELELCGRTVGVLAAIARALVMMAMLQYLWLSFGSPFYSRMVSMNNNRQPETFGGITSTEQGSALTAGPTAGQQAHSNNSTRP